MDLRAARSRGPVSQLEREAALAYAAAVAAAQCTRASAWGPTSADVERLLAETGVPSGE